MLKKIHKNNKNFYKNIKIIGLTGGIGSGKSSVSKMFADFGIKIIDADKISHGLTADKNGKALKKILKIFGEKVFLQTKPFLCLNRQKLRDLVFDKNTHNKKILENILHPLILLEIKKSIKKIKKNFKNLVEKNKKNYVILDVPLLYESPKIQGLCHKIISVECEKNIQIKRVQKRNGFDVAMIEKIINSQASPQQRQKMASFIIQNNTNFENLKNQVQNLHKVLNKKLKFAKIFL